MAKYSSLVAKIRVWTPFFARISYRHDFMLVIQALSKRRRFHLPSEIWSIVEPTGGFLSVKEARLLYWAASESPVSGPVLELGSFEGRSTLLFALSGRTVHAVDAWSTETLGDKESAEAVFRHFKENIQRADVEALVSIHRGLTHEVGKNWTVPGAILFVDAGHEYEDVRDDLNIWTPHLLPDGLLLMHDVLGGRRVSVVRAASEVLRQDWRVVASAGGIVAFTRK